MYFSNSIAKPKKMNEAETNSDFAYDDPPLESAKTGKGMFCYSGEIHIHAYTLYLLNKIMCISYHTHTAKRLSLDATYSDNDRDDPYFPLNEFLRSTDDFHVNTNTIDKEHNPNVENEKLSQTDMLCKF